MWVEDGCSVDAATYSPQAVTVAAKRRNAKMMYYPLALTILNGYNPYKTTTNQVFVSSSSQHWARILRGNGGPGGSHELLQPWGSFVREGAACLSSSFYLPWKIRVTWIMIYGQVGSSSDRHQPCRDEMITNRL